MIRILKQLFFMKFRDSSCSLGVLTEQDEFFIINKNFFVSFFLCKYFDVFRIDFSNDVVVSLPCVH